MLILFLIYLNLVFTKVVYRNDIQCNKHEKLPRCVIEHYTVNLDLPPNERWKELVLNYKEKLLTLDSKVGYIFGKLYVKILLFICSLFSKKMPVEYYEEMKAIADLSGIEIEGIILMNIFYEFSSACTSIISADYDGYIYHARTLDFGKNVLHNSKTASKDLRDFLRSISVYVTFTKNGVDVAKSIMFVGQVGIFTGTSVNKFSLSINQRFALDGGYVGLMKYLLNYKDIQFVSFLARDVLLNSKNYDEALTTLSTTELVAPVYYILSNYKIDGAIITRQRTYSKDIIKLNLSNNTWFLVQTNTDIISTAHNDDERYKAAYECMLKFGRQELCPRSLYNVLTSHLIKSELTIYISISFPTAFYLEGYTENDVDTIK